MWAQCTAWFKQTVYDPTASLSAERRGMLSLPDVETAYLGVGILILGLSMLLVSVPCMQSAWRLHQRQEQQELNYEEQL